MCVSKATVNFHIMSIKQNQQSKMVIKSGFIDYQYCLSNDSVNAETDEFELTIKPFFTTILVIPTTNTIICQQRRK